MSVPPDQMPAAPQGPAGPDATPPAAAPDDGGVGFMQDTLAYDKGIADQERQKLDQTIGNFKPPTNPNPEFTEQQPQDHFNSIVGLAPILMALGAVGGKFGNVHGIAMIQSTNAMMKGMVQGSADQYSDARQQYEQKFETWKAGQKTWFDTYKAYMEAYKGSVDAQQRAVAAANQSVGIDQKDLTMTQNQVMQQKKLAALIEFNHAKMTRMDSQSATDAIRAASDREKADAAATRADTGVDAEARKRNSAADKSKQGDEAMMKATSQIDGLEDLIRNNSFTTGFGNKGRQLVEFASSSLTGDTNLPATRVATAMRALELQIPRLLELKGGSGGKWKAEEIHEAFSALKGATSGPMAIEKLDYLKSLLAPEDGNAVEINGVKYKIGANGAPVRIQ